MPRNFSNFFAAFGIPAAESRRRVQNSPKQAEESKTHASDYYSRKQLKHARNAVLSAELLVFAFVLALVLRALGW